MTTTRWRTLAGLLALTIGGLVVWASDKPKVLPAARCDCPQCPVRCENPPGCPPVECPCQLPTDPCTMPCLPPAVPLQELQVIKPVVMTTAVATVPYKIRLEMIGAVTQIELVRGDEMALRVQCDKADLQMPSGGLCATGKVCISGPGIDIRCNRMMIGWQGGDMSMEGQVRIVSQNGNQRTLMSAEKIHCRINSFGTGLEVFLREVEKAEQE